jgi:hypothetical protein
MRIGERNKNVHPLLPQPLSGTLGDLKLKLESSTGQPVPFDIEIETQDPSAMRGNRCSRVE